MTRFLSLIFAYVSLALALIGVLLPGIPTVPFLLLAAWFSAKSSERLHRWIYGHPYLGKLLIDWERQGEISRSTKVVAVLMLIASWVVMYYRSINVWVFAAATILFIIIGTFLISRPEPHKD